MMMKKIAHFCALAFCSLPIVAFATTDSDIYVTNNTNLYGTGYFSFSPCSSMVPNGDGIVKPHQAGFKIPGSFIKIFCGSSDCEATIFASKDCSGPKKGVVTVNANKGVVKITNYDKEHFNVTGSGNNITVSQVSGSFTDWIKSLF